ncbi:methyltransferase regulatory domain-containing protein [Mesobacterium pallidum]|uniref:methyltransferase regulatory domain-containing protein n=1 Tax=Mesobacterium pallidum TaxID=2872037 RepID=UPI001EE266A7|nr:class I SAM-dependent methyltransferase [Mesobacterium pallidum]
MTDAPGGFFNDLPYTSYPFPDTRPEQMAALGVALGLTPPPVATARVLELGCASGGNLIPLAARYPGARFLGIDLSQRHVEIAGDRIAALGLTNIEIRQGDLGEDGLDPGPQDYIIAHGLYSWVPAGVQGRILDLLGRCLAPDGIGYVSYNVLPGWQQRKIVRDIFQFDDDPARSPADRVARGRWLLEQLAKGSSDKTTYGQLLRQEAEALSTLAENYLMSEFLVEDNRPCYFHEFMADARARGLAFLTESRLALAFPGMVDPQRDQLVRAMAGPGVESYEQYTDFLQGRQFRQTLLVPAEAAARVARRAEPRRMAGLHYASQLRVQPGEPGAAERRLARPDGSGLKTNDPGVIQALDALGRAWPETRTPRDLLAGLQGLPGIAPERLSERVMEALLRTAVAGYTHVLAGPVSSGRAADDRPRVLDIARAELAAGQDWVTTLHHAPLRIGPEIRQALPLIDGTRDHAALAGALPALVTAEDDPLDLAAPRAPDPQALVSGLLARLEAMGLLAPPAPDAARPTSPA